MKLLYYWHTCLIRHVTLIYKCNCFVCVQLYTYVTNLLRIRICDICTLSEVIPFRIHFTNNIKGQCLWYIYKFCLLLLQRRSSLLNRTTERTFLNDTFPWCQCLIYLREKKTEKGKKNNIYKKRQGFQITLREFVDCLHPSPSPLYIWQSRILISSKSIFQNMKIQSSEWQRHKTNALSIVLYCKQKTSSVIYDLVIFCNSLYCIFFSV